MYEAGWQRGGINALSYAFTDFFTDERANRTAQDFAREKIRETVRDPAVAGALCPAHHIGTKRTCVDIGYFETYNRDDVQLLFDNSFINNFGLTSTNDLGGAEFLNQINAAPGCPGSIPCYRDGFRFVAGAKFRIALAHFAKRWLARRVFITNRYGAGREVEQADLISGFDHLDHRTATS